MAEWIWYDGDMELYHGTLIHGRRERSGSYCPIMFRADPPLKFVTFEKTARTDGETIVVRANTEKFLIIADGKRIYRTNKVVLEPGEHTVVVSAHKENGFPCIYIEGNVFASDGSWSAYSQGYEKVPAGRSDMFVSPDDDPEIFPFEYRLARPVSSERRGEGILFDFGRETFGKLRTEAPEGTKLDVYYGESEAEALHMKETVITDTAVGGDVLRPRAFRYVFIVPNCEKAEFDSISLSADEEFISRDKPGSFKCDDEEINRIVDVCSYTLEINMREAIFDGIKRDRWVWSGDAYQSFLVNYYSFFDSDSVRRTARILRGRDPMTQHINTIPDYSALWLMGIRDYYLYTGDADFIRREYRDMETLIDFTRSRLDENGFVVERDGDFVFIDWHDYFDREGPLCAEQMFLWAGYRAMAEISEAIGEDENARRYDSLADKLKSDINRLYWNEERGAFVDSFTSGRNNVTRHANIIALRYGFSDRKQSELIIENVIENDEIPAITTPYFKFFELDAMLTAGKSDLFRDMLGSYWGEMIRLGATTIWEEFDPNMKGDEHYAMYGLPFEKSLCHAWGASPVYLLGKYALGVRPTSPGYEKYEVCPQTMGLENFEGIVPTPAGCVRVKYTDGKITVESDIPGGTLKTSNGDVPIPAGEKITARI